MSDTIARLAAMSAQRASIGNVTEKADHFQNLEKFGSNPGALSAKFYIPDGLPDNSPLVVVLHGCTQTASAYDHGSGWSQLADEAKFAVLYPEQQRSNNANLCFNWFVPADTRRDSGEAHSIRQMIDALVDAHGLDKRRIYVTGLSAGGAMTSVMLAAYPEVFAAGAIIAGLPYGSAKTVPEAFDRMRGHGGPSEKQLQQSILSASDHKGPRPRISIWHGSADRTVANSNADEIFGQWRGLHKIGESNFRSEIIDGQQRKTWHDAQGQPLIEAYSIEGMGHGTPVDAAKLGNAGPFMLDVGISSTRHIAQFWGISGNKSENSTGKKSPRENLPANSRELSKTDGTVEKPRPLHVEAPQAKKKSGNAVQTIIEDALRSAGLLR